MRDFKIPDLGEMKRQDVVLDYAFQLKARYDPPNAYRSAKGGRFYQAIIGGTVRSPRLNADVYADSGGQFDTLQVGNSVRNVNAHFMLKAENDEYIYVEHVGYHRPDGYYRAIAYIDAPTDGPYDWLNGTTFVVTATEGSDMRDVVFTYYVAN